MRLVKPVPPECVKTLGYGPYPADLIARFGRAFHLGIDFAFPSTLRIREKAIFAAADGSVLQTGFNLRAGNFIILSHITPQNLVLTYYLHLDSQLCFRNDAVLARQKIGIMGNTGDSTDTHLHFGAAILYITDIHFFDPAPHFIN